MRPSLVLLICMYCSLAKGQALLLNKDATKSDLKAAIDAGFPANYILNNLSYDAVKKANAGYTKNPDCSAELKFDQTIASAQSVMYFSIVNMIAETADAYYEWIDCRTGKAIPDEHNQIFNPKENGEYALAVTKNGCQSFSSCYTVRTAGNVPNDFGPSLHLQTNPSEGSVTVHLGKSFNNVHVQLYNMTGQVSLDKRFNGAIDNFSLIISDLPQGAYFISIEDEDGRMATMNIIKE